MNAPKKIKVYNLINNLKRKLGRDPDAKSKGFIAPEAIADADKIIEVLCRNCPQTIAGQLEALDKVWDRMKVLPESEERKKCAEEIFTIAHEIKDISAMCGYTLAAYFGESLRDYIELTNLSMKAQQVIVQAHIDAMQTTHKKGLKDDGGPLAEELKRLVKIAVEKYS